MSDDPVRVLGVVGAGAEETAFTALAEEATAQSIQLTGAMPTNEALKYLKEHTSEIDAVVLSMDPLAGEFGDTLHALHDQEKPVVVMASRQAPAAMMEAITQGAQECFLPDELTGDRLARALRYAIRRHHWRTRTSEHALATARAEVARSQQQLRDSEALYHSLVENLVQNIFRKDTNGRFTFANTNFCLTIGKHVNQILGRTDLDLFPVDLARKYQADDHKVITSGSVFEAEEEHQSQSGERLVVKVVKTPVYNAAGEIAGMQGIFWDITEQKKAQEELAASRERFAIAVRGTTDGIWDWDLRTKDIYFSSRFLELLGYQYGEWDNRLEEWTSKLHPEDKDEALAALNEHLEKDTPYDVEYRLKCRDESYRWFRARGLAVRDETGEATRMAGSISDISTRKEAERQLQARSEDLERSNRDLEQFAYIASHDLKEPLRMVSSYVQLLEHRYASQLNDDAREFIGFAVDGAKRMKRLIDGLLEFSRVGTRGQELAPISADEVLAEALSNLDLLIQEKGANVTKKDLPNVLADRVQLSQLFQNLVGNALKFCENVPTIHISAERCEEDASTWIFSIRDNGIGIDPNHADKIFQIYQRLHSRETYEGTGIGLAVCRKIVERHGGKIWVESEVGEGATFRFTVRDATAAEESSE